MLSKGDYDLAVTRQVTDRACLMHCIQTNFLVHFLSGCLILPQWHLKHSSCSETPKQLQIGCHGPRQDFNHLGLQVRPLHHAAPLCQVCRKINICYFCLRWGLGFFWFGVLFVNFFFIWDYASHPSLPAWIRNTKWNTAQHSTWPQMSDHIQQTTISSVRKHTVENVCLVIHPSFCKGEGEVKGKSGGSPLIHTHTRMHARTHTYTTCQLLFKLIDANKCKEKNNRNPKHFWKWWRGTSSPALQE